MLGFVFYGEKPCFLCPSDTVVQECSICGLWGGSENDTWVLELYVDKIFVRTQVGTHEERVDHCYVEGFHFTPPFTLQCQQWQCWEVVVCLKITNDMVDIGPLLRTNEYVVIMWKTSDHRLTGYCLCMNSIPVLGTSKKIISSCWQYLRHKSLIILTFEFWSDFYLHFMIEIWETWFQNVLATNLCMGED